MFTFVSTNFNCVSKDARSNAPSTSFAHNCAHSSNIAVITGIAVAVSVFLYAIISIITAIMMCELNVIIMSAIIIFAINIIMIKTKKFNNRAKLYAK